MATQPVKIIFPDGLERRFTSMSSAAIYTGTTVQDISAALNVDDDPFMPEPLRGAQVLVWDEKPRRSSYEWVVVKKEGSKHKLDGLRTKQQRSGRKIKCKHQYVIVSAVSAKQAVFLAANGVEYDATKNIGITSINCPKETTT